MADRWKGRSGRPDAKPSFYQYSQGLLEREAGSEPLKKGALVRVGLVFPNRYAVGMANLGFQTVYRLFNEHPDVRCERIFLYEIPYEKDIKSLETNVRLDQFDFVGFSLSFELDFLHILHLLNRANIAVLLENRTDTDPLIFCGGAVCSLNPSPLLPFMDGLLVGEGEGVIQRIADTLYHHRLKKNSRAEILNSLSEIEGIFIPNVSRTVRRHIVSSIESNPVYTPIITPLSHFENMFVIETGRGCKRGCFFCAACKIYSPHRFHSSESIIETIKQKNPGTRRIGLEGAGLSDYPGLYGLCRALIDLGYQVSFSSIRPDCLSSGWIDLIQKGGAHSITIAPEAGTEKLRKRIGKGITDDVILKNVKLLGESDIDTLKLYFLIGLPGETEKEIYAIVDLVKELKALFRHRGKKKRIRVSINAFIPKPFTEFQWAAMNREKDLMKKRKIIRQGLKREPGVHVMNKSTKDEVLQAVLSLGDQHIGLALQNAIMNKMSWKNAFHCQNIDYTSFLYEDRALEDNLPWDFIKCDISKQALWKRYSRSVLDYC